ncbi:MAG: glycosyltransferase family 39 protein [Planctomycetes bacterium]|nr:glycosyltransferase family 39 protein [Planctomycetota bacterium]
MKIRDPRVVGALLAAAVRGVVSWQAWRTNDIVSSPRLDAEYYLSWAGDIASGDVLGRHATVGGGPFLLNPLYAYVIAPLVALFGATPGPVLVAQAVLAAGTAALSAGAAKRWAGDTAAWVAAIAVAFSVALTHLDGYVAVSGLAAFLVAGTCYACAPDAAGDGAPGVPRWRGPLAAGAWLGLSVLARPVALFAVPFVAWAFASRGERKARVVALLLAPILLCAALSFARNAVVSGERVVFTAANGQNLYLGNNTAARRMGAMFTDEFRFSPREMHEDARFRVAAEIGREPTRSEISDWFAARAWDELRQHPGDSIAWTLTKARWFLSPEEPASSADLAYDRTLTPLLGLAFVPTWLLLALGAAGVAVSRARRDLVLAPGAIVIAHWVACTLTFPLSHYRSPAIPAMAVLAGCAVAAVSDALRSGRGRPMVVAVLTAVVVGVVGHLGPQPAYRRDTVLVNGAVTELRRGALDAAARGARAALDVEPESLGAVTVMMDVERARGRLAEAHAWADRRVASQPWNPLFRVEVARLDYIEGKRAEALATIDRLVEGSPWSATLRARRGEFRCDAGDLAGASDDLRFALARGVRPETWALEKCGIE